jgi:hypothetical protein
VQLLAQRVERQLGDLSRPAVVGQLKLILEPRPGIKLGVDAHQLVAAAVDDRAVFQGVQLAHAGAADPLAGRPAGQLGRGLGERIRGRDDLGRRTDSLGPLGLPVAVGIEQHRPGAVDHGGGGAHRLEAGEPDHGVHVGEQVPSGGDEQRLGDAGLVHRLGGPAGPLGVDGPGVQRR